MSPEGQTVSQIWIFRRLFVFWAVILLILTSYPGLKINQEKLFDLDKLAHFGFYLILGLLFLASRFRREFKDNLLLLVLLALIVPLLDEMHQIPIPGRDFSWWDILADLLGLYTAMLFALLNNRFRRFLSS
ncbi:MAG: VanZ family protein [Candidatus Cloacimonetes bacterium]|nr:VanZ family protein [Candidatus Cloacimonadota bacterium]